NLRAHPEKFPRRHATLSPRGRSRGRMQPAINLTLLPLHDALGLAQAMALRPDLDPAQRLAAPAWTAAASATLLRRDQAGLETLLRAELAPAVAEATALLGTAVTAASWWPEDAEGDLERWVMEMSVRIDKACRAVLHAIDVVRVAEQWEALVDPDRAAPTRPEAGAGSRVLEEASRYLQTKPQDRARRAVHEDLADAL